LTLDAVTRSETNQDPVRNYGEEVDDADDLPTFNFCLDGGNNHRYSMLTVEAVVPQSDGMHSWRQAQGQSCNDNPRREKQEKIQPQKIKKTPLHVAPVR
jgi:hypothetical protein